MSREMNQQRHEQVVAFLNSFEQYNGRFEIVNTERNYNDLPLVDTNDINGAVVVITDLLNLPGGSSGNDFDLYELLQAYFQIPSCRESINSIVKEAKFS